MTALESRQSPLSFSLPSGLSETCVRPRGQCSLDRPKHKHMGERGQKDGGIIRLIELCDHHRKYRIRNFVPFRAQRHIHYSFDENWRSIDGEHLTSGMSSLFPLNSNSEETRLFNHWIFFNFGKWGSEMRDVIDPATEAFILNKNKNSVNLYQYYDNGKSRMDTQQIQDGHSAEVALSFHPERNFGIFPQLMLREVRAGLDVVGVFYGRPGVFVNPSHRALAIRRECFLVYLQRIASTPTCWLTRPTLNVLPTRHPILILFQVGCVGVADFPLHGI